MQELIAAILENQKSLEQIRKDIDILMKRNEVILEKFQEQDREKPSEDVLDQEEWKELFQPRVLPKFEPRELTNEEREYNRKLVEEYIRKRPCEALNKHGKPCRNNAEVGSKYCETHEFYEPPVSTKCKAMTKQGKPCNCTATIEGYCKRHHVV